MSEPSPRYARQLALRGFSQAEQDRLAAASVLLVGLGGLGCPAAHYLAGAGVGELVLNDFDTVRVSNLHRQTLYSDSAVGERKLSVAANRVAAINPEIKITVVDERLDEAGLHKRVGSVDLVLDATDNFASRQAINAACVAHGRTLISGAAAGLDGQLGIYPCDRGGACYQCFLGDVDDNLGDCETTGILGPVTGVIGSLMAQEAVKILAGFSRPLSSQLLVYDGASTQLRQLKIGRRDQCQICGTASL